MTDVDPTAEPIPAADAPPGEPVVVEGDVQPGDVVDVVEPGAPADAVVEGDVQAGDAAEVVPDPAAEAERVAQAVQGDAAALAEQEAAEAAAHLAAQDAEAERVAAEREAEQADELTAIAGVDPAAAAIPPQGLEVPAHPEPEIVIVGVKQDNVTQPGTELTHTLGSQGYVTSAHETAVAGTVDAEVEVDLEAETEPGQ